MTLQARDAVSYVDDLVREADQLLQRAEALMEAATAIVAKLAQGESYNL